MSLAVYLSADLEVVIIQDRAACETNQAAGVEFLTLLGLQVLTFNAVIAAFAERVVELVIMLLTIRVIVDDIKVSRCKGRLAGFAYEACCSVSDDKITSPRCTYIACGNGQ